MGGCVSPTFAEIFMSYYETLQLSNCPSESKPVLYRRYADDTFLLLRSELNFRLFLDYFNSQHPSNKYTHESERNEYLPFLDISVRKTEHEFETSLFHMDTFTGLTMKYNSALPYIYKFNLIQCLWYRAF